MKNTALITGASSGIGREFAKIHASHGGDMVVVARSGDELEALKVELEEKHKISVVVLVADLTDHTAPQMVFDATTAAGIEIEVLINNAGFGGHGNFVERDLAKEKSMIDLNIRALTELSHLYGNEMVKQGKGKILNIGSTAGFLPGPLQAVYYATKAYVNSFSQALAEELRDTGVTVTVLCPGPTKSGFMDAADLEGAQAFKMKMTGSREVAESGYQSMLDGKLMDINETKYRLMMNWMVPLVPRKMMLKISRQTMEK